MKAIFTYIKNNIISITIGLIYLWFGGLKMIPNMSPAEDLAKTTINELTFGLVPAEISLPLLAILEITIGGCLLFGLYKNVTYRMGILHISLTFTPILLFPSEVFQNNILELTLLGQYIMKNIVILSALLILLKENKSKIGIQVPEG